MNSIWPPWLYLILELDDLSVAEVVAPSADGEATVAWDEVTGRASASVDPEYTLFPMAR